MSKNRKTGLKFLSNDWVVTLSATLIGVFAALWLNEMVSSKKLEQQKTIAKQNIVTEIEQNQKSLEESIKKLELMLNVVTFFNPKMDEEGRLITTPDSIARFRANHPGIFKIEDSTKLENGRYNYRGEIDLDFNLSHINLTTLALKTLKSSGLSATFDFNCLMNLERLEKFTNETLQKEKKVLEELYKVMGTEKTEAFAKQVKTLISFERTLLEFYAISEQDLKDCH